ncbi:low-density lipoprotein receptor-related protein 4-like [Ornithodoros turicata]|uniref:low-density lipoprotein receptor-related protein 4-like n=1 Tax=Ornithodoros turicata TaxID=34597 RepID=UPI003139A010
MWPKRFLALVVLATFHRTSAECPNGTFDCGDGQCISEDHRCDGDNDCETGLDEADCPQQWCPVPDTLCDGRCLPQRWRCDGERQCSDGADEDGCDACSLKHCSQGCKFVAGEAMCYCTTGFRLLEDGVGCEDEDECADDTHNCEQTCINLPGAYRCSCMPGYETVNTTLCQADGPEPLLFYCDNQKVYGVWMRSNQTFYVGAGEKRARVVDFDGDTNRVYWAGSKERSLYYCYMNSTDCKMLSITSYSNSQIDGLAFDWVTGNLYIADREMKRIDVCTTDDSRCVPIVSKAGQKPRAIVLRPEIATMYWTDWGAAPSIWQAYMDGSKPFALVTERIEWPNGLAYDRPTNRLYWCDGRRNTIEYLDMRTRKRTLLLRRDDVHPFSLAVFESTAYWSDWTSDTIDMFNKYDGTHRGHLFPKRSIDVMGISIYHPSLRPKNITNPCKYNPCTEICALAEGGFKCLCSDGERCEPRAGHVVPLPVTITEAPAAAEEPTPPSYRNDTSYTGSLYAADAGVLYHVKHNVLFHTGLEVTKLAYDTAVVVGAMAHDSVRNNLYISDTNGKKILRMNTLSNEVALVHDYNSGNVPAMDFDTANGLLYWVNGDMNTLEVCNWNGSAHVVLLQKLRQPYDVALYPKGGVLFVLSLVDFTAITRYTMDGKNPRKLRMLSGFRPLSLSVDLWSEKLFWADASRDGIASVSLKTTKYWPVTVVEGFTTDMHRLIAADNLVHWVTMVDTNIHFMHIGEGITRQLNLNGTATITAVVRTKEQPDTEPGVCTLPKFTSCGQICVPSGRSAVCL